MRPETSVDPNDPLQEEMDQDFLALVTAQCQQPPVVPSVQLPSQGASMLGKRKAEEDPKVEELKERNRQSAKASRERKKSRLALLHQQVDDLTKQNLELAQTATELADDNESLWAELETLGVRRGADLKQITARSAVAEVVPRDDGVAAKDCLGSFPQATIAV